VGKQYGGKNKCERVGFKGAKSSSLDDKKLYRVVIPGWTSLSAKVAALMREGIPKVGSKKLGVNSQIGRGPTHDQRFAERIPDRCYSAC